MSERCIISYQDNDTKQFIENCIEKADWIITQIVNSLLQFFLMFFMTKTSINGLEDLFSTWTVFSELQSFMVDQLWLVACCCINLRYVCVIAVYCIV